MKKRLLAVLLALCLALALMPAAVFAADQITVPNNGEMDKNHPDLFHFGFPAEYRDKPIKISLIDPYEETLRENQDYVLYRYEKPYFCFTQEFLLSLEEGKTHEFVFIAILESGAQKITSFSFTLPETYPIYLEVTPEGAGAIAVEGYSDSQQKIYYAPKDQELEMGPAIDENLYRFVGWKVNGQEPDPAWVQDEYLIFTPASDCTVTLEVEARESAMQITPAKLDFGTVKVGYDQPDYQTVTVTNSGETNLFLPAPQSEYYDIAGPFYQPDVLEIYDYLHPGDTVYFHIAPKEGLPVGDYSASLTFQGKVLSSPQIMALSFDAPAAKNGPDWEPYAVAQLDIFFQVVDDSGSFTPNATPNPNPGNLSQGGGGEDTGRQDDNPNTGDSGLPALALLPVSGLAALGLILFRKKRA